MRKPSYAGPNDISQFDDRAPDEAVRIFTSYGLLGDCFEQASDDDMVGRGWLIQHWGASVRNREEQAASQSGVIGRHQPGP